MTAHECDCGRILLTPHGWDQFQCPCGIVWERQLEWWERRK